MSDFTKDRIRESIINGVTYADSAQFSLWNWEKRKLRLEDPGFVDLIYVSMKEIINEIQFHDVTT